MTPGPTKIVACPHCAGLGMYATINSGNTFGATNWTDGKQIAPKLPRPPAVVKCRHCAQCYWLADAEEVGTIDLWGREGRDIDSAWIDVEKVQEPAEEEYYDALETGLAKDAMQERKLRILAWWRRNDAFRHAGAAGAQQIAGASGRWRENLEALAGLLDEAKENDRIMKAELLRELGEFEAAQQLLSRVTSEPYAAAIRQLRRLCEAVDVRVQVLQFGD